jgi:hypothetical protein
MSDYCKVTNTLWREGIEIAMRHQGACGDAFSDAMKSWHSTWTGGFEKAAAMNPAAMPFWFIRLSMPAALPQPPNLQADGSIQSGERIWGWLWQRVAARSELHAGWSHVSHGQCRAIRMAPGAVRPFDADQAIHDPPA